MTDLDAIQAAVKRAAAFQRHADENGYGRPVHPETAMTDLEQLAARLVKVAVEGSGFVPGGSYAVEYIPPAVAAVLRELERHLFNGNIGPSMGYFSGLADFIEKAAGE